MNKRTDKRGIWFLSAWIWALIFGVLAVVFFALLIFNQNIKEAVALFTTFFNQAKLYILIGIALIVLWQTGLLKLIVSKLHV